MPNQIVLVSRRPYPIRWLAIHYFAFQKATFCYDFVFKLPRSVFTLLRPFDLAVWLFLCLSLLLFPLALAAAARCENRAVKSTRNSKGSPLAGLSNAFWFSYGILLGEDVLTEDSVSCGGVAAWAIRQVWSKTEIIVRCSTKAWIATPKHIFKFLRATMWEGNPTLWPDKALNCIFLI